MRTALRKMGNSIGMIVPSAVLRAAGVATGTVLEIAVEDGRIVAAPVTTPVRSGWAAAAALLAENPLSADDGAEAADWQGFGNEGDAELTW